MATREETTNSYTYLVVKHHSICEESKVEKDKFEPVDVFNPKTKETSTKWIDKWGALTGYIVNIEAYDTGTTYETRFQGFKLNIDDEVILDLPQKTPAYDAFCKLAENIDFSKEVTLSAYHNRKKDRTGFNVKQDGNNVDWKYTQDNMEDCPPWEQIDGEWDSRKQRAFLKAKVIDVVIPACQKAAEERGVSVEAPETQAVAATASAPSATASVAPAKAKGGKKSAVDTSDIPF
jgi:hypothetical protein